MECCCVCFSDESLLLSCCHPCCLSCVKKIIKLNSLCPLCRQKFDTEPFKYKPPTHRPNLKTSVKQKKLLNTFFNNRYFLSPCKKQRLYSFLLFKHTDQLAFQNKFIHIDSMLLGEIIYDANFLIDCLIWLHINNKTYSYSMRQNFIYAIRSELSGRLN
jgi:hypothetical protein